MESMSLAQVADQLIQLQFAMFETICAEAGVTIEDQARTLRLPPDVWRRWRQFLAGTGTRPTVPSVSDLLLRIGSASFELTAREPRSAVI